MFGSALRLKSLLRVVAHLARDVGEAQQVVAGGEDRRGAVLDARAPPGARLLVTLPVPVVSTTQLSQRWSASSKAKAPLCVP